MGESSYGKIVQNISSKFSGGGLGNKSKSKIDLSKSFIDLTPASYFINIKTRRAKRQMVYTNILIVGLCILGLGGAGAYNLLSQNELNELNDGSNTIAEELAKFQEENLAIEQVKNIQGKLDIAQSPSVNWSQVIATIEGSLPGGTIVSSLSVNVDSEIGAGRSTNVRLTLNSDNPLGYADTLASINSIENISNVVIGGMTGGGSGQFAYSVTFNFDESFRVQQPDTLSGANTSSEGGQIEDDNEGLTPEELLLQAGGLDDDQSDQSLEGTENEETE